MKHEEIRKRHPERLGGYRQSLEYAHYASEIGAEVPVGELPQLIGDRWEIDADTYREFLEVLPPLSWKGDTFYMSEFTFGDITTKYTKEGDRYFCEFARFPERRESQVPIYTPWGVPDSTTEIAPGIVNYSTPSHGGFWLSPARVASMSKCLREFKPFAGPNFYEEDCDWAIVAVAFPKFFPADAVGAAMETLKMWKPALHEQVVAAGISGGRSA